MYVLYFSVVLLTVSVCVFGAKAHMENGAVVLAQQKDALAPRFGWSYWVAVGAGAMALFSSCLYFCVGRKKERTYYD